MPNVAFNLLLIVHVSRIVGVGVFEYIRRAFVKPLVAALVPAALWGLALANWPTAIGWGSLLIIGGVGVALYALLGVLIEVGPQQALRWLAARRRAAVNKA